MEEQALTSYPEGFQKMAEQLDFIEGTQEEKEGFLWSVVFLALSESP